MLRFIIIALLLSAAMYVSISTATMPVSLIGTATHAMAIGYTLVLIPLCAFLALAVYHADKPTF